MIVATWIAIAVLTLAVIAQGIWIWSVKVDLESDNIPHHSRPFVKSEWVKRKISFVGEV